MPAISLTFDGPHIAQWRMARGLFATYQVRATFFVTPDQLNDATTESLRLLQGDGHEIGMMGQVDGSFAEYLQKKTPRDYLKNEVKSGLKTFSDFGFRVRSFACPAEEIEQRLVIPLLTQFGVLRRLPPAGRPGGRVYHKAAQNVVDCMGSLNMGSDGTLTEDYYQKCFRQTLNRTGLSVFSGNGICRSEDANSAEHMRPDDLEWFLWSAKQKNIRALPLSVLER
ncbi:MAG: polysaccharide deacetylase family protein [Pseudoruegeria sp.]